MARRGRCPCGSIVEFESSPDGYKTRCAQCGAVIRLRPGEPKSSRRRARVPASQPAAEPPATDTAAATFSLTALPQPPAAFDPFAGPPTIEEAVPPALASDQASTLPPLDDFATLLDGSELEFIDMEPWPAPGRRWSLWWWASLFVIGLALAFGAGILLSRLGK